MTNWWIKEREHFGGFRVESPPGLQEAALTLLKSVTPERSSVLDLASGSGVMNARLEAAGFTDRHCVAREARLCGDPGYRQPDHPDAKSLDLNDEFATHFGRRFRIVISLEVIEHLASPRAFLEQAAQLLEPGGFLVLTTPNVANWIGRLRFLVRGELRWFDRFWSRELKHISPITHGVMCNLLDEGGFELVAVEAAGSFTGPLAALVTLPISLPFLLFGRRRAWGDCSVYLARKRP